MHTFLFFFLLISHGVCEQGNQYDLRAIKNALADMFPHGDFLLSSTNENDTYTDIQTLGANLAEEVDRRTHAHIMHVYPPAYLYISVYTHSNTSTPSHTQTPQVDRHIQQSVVPVARLSFIGHSLGGIIVRAALTHPLLRQHRAKLHTFCSLGSPHLGYLYTDNSLVDGGLWFLKKVKNSTALHQFALTDSKDPLTTFMYRYAYATPLLLVCIRDTSVTGMHTRHLCY